MDEKEKITVKEENGKGISRRTFMKGLATVGVGLTFASHGVRLAKAQYARWTAGDLSETKLIDMYTGMLRSRLWERGVNDLFLLGQDNLYGYYHLSAGQEAVSFGVAAALEPGDYIASTHRGHADVFSKQGPTPDFLNKAMAEIIFKASGTNLGYGGSMHIMQKDVGMLGEDGVVGPGACYGAGAAHALRARGKGEIALTFGGDAHATTPYFHIALNEAATHRIPWVYVIENNQYMNALGQHISEAINVRDIADMAAAYGIPGHVVDGMDVLEVYQVTKTAVDRARAGDGPTLIEAKCYRYYEHFGARGVKPGVLGAFRLGYRSDREVRSWLARDPIVKFRKNLIDFGVLAETEADELEAEVKKDMEATFEWADKEPVPKAEDGLKNVFVEGTVLPRQLADCPLYEGFTPA